MNRLYRYLLFVCTLTLFATSCDRPPQTTRQIYKNTYKSEDLLLISSKQKQDEGWIEVQEKPVEFKYGKTDRLYFVYQHNSLVGFITADGRSYQTTWDELPYEINDKTNLVPVERYIGTWRTMELNVQHILGLPYPVTIR